MATTAGVFHGLLPALAHKVNVVLAPTSSWCHLSLGKDTLPSYPASFRLMLQASGLNLVARVSISGLLATSCMTMGVLSLIPLPAPPQGYSS